MKISKEILLKTGIFIDNEYLDKYVDLINNHEECYKKHETEIHHIIPKYYYNRLGIDVDNSENNKSCLLYSDHIKAHYFLAKCSILPEDRSKNALSIRFILKGKSLDELGLDDVDFEYYNKIHEESKIYVHSKVHTPEINKRVSEKLTGRVSPNKGNKKEKVFVSKKNPNAKNKKLSEIACTRTGDKNPFYGKKHTEESLNKMRERRSKPVEMIDFTSGEVLNTFNSCKEAGKHVRDLGITKNETPEVRISRVCRSNDQGQKAYGFNWRFANKV